MTSTVHLRAVSEADLPAFFEHQHDPLASQLADFPSRDWDSFSAHWAKILTDDQCVIRTVVYEGHTAGNIVAFPQSGKTLIGYWLGRDLWGRGIGTQALTLFLDEVTSRPLFAYVAKRNTGSIRVLEKCGFVRWEDAPQEALSGGEPDELLYKFEAGVPSRSKV
ncbi:MAG TPA: GNAT family N-acetyltransferase [Anaerolineales bacterium]|nr:GNAT family N-acetyltransferase [Anaerolineales bacterium]